MREQIVNFNPFLKPWLAPQPNNVAGKGVIEKPGETENFIWQTRKAEPTQYENDFGDALEKVFEAGANGVAGSRRRFEPRGLPYSGRQCVGRRSSRRRIPPARRISALSRTRLIAFVSGVSS